MLRNILMIKMCAVGNNNSKFYHILNPLSSIQPILVVRMDLKSLIRKEKLISHQRKIKVIMLRNTLPSIKGKMHFLPLVVTHLLEESLTVEASSFKVVELPG